MINVYKCKNCGRLLVLVDNGDSLLACCGENMEKVKSNNVDFSFEKHVPVVNVTNNIATVSVGSIEHPMDELHYIEWVLLETNKGNKRVFLKPTDKPVARFALLEDEKVLKAYAYCNLHGLWESK